MEDVQGYFFEAVLEHPKALLNALRSIRLRKKLSVLELSSAGLKLLSEEDKWIQAVAVLDRQLFRQFEFKRDESVSFEISIDHVELCLNQFGSEAAHSTVKMVYPGRSGTFVIFLEDSGIFSECELFTFECGDAWDMEDYSSSMVSTKILFNSDFLKEIFAEMDQSTSWLKFEVENGLQENGKLAFSTSTMRIEVGKKSDYVLVFESDHDQEAKYNIKILRVTQKALSLSEKTCCRLLKDGRLALQFLLNTEARVDICVEFICKALEPCDVDDELV